MEAGDVDLVLSAWQHPHQRHVRYLVHLEDGVHRDDAAAIGHQAAEQRVVAPPVGQQNVLRGGGELHKAGTHVR